MHKKCQNWGIQFYSNFECKPIPTSHPRPVCLAGSKPRELEASNFSRVARQFCCRVVKTELLLQSVWISTNWLSLMENVLLGDFQPMLLIMQGKNRKINKKRCFNSLMSKSIWFHDSTYVQAFLKIHVHWQKMGPTRFHEVLWKYFIMTKNCRSKIGLVQPDFLLHF